MATFPTTPTPDQGASKEVKTRVKSMKFGDGYENRVGDGINTVSQDWSLQWTLRTKAEITSLDSFLEAQLGVYWFFWTSPLGVQKKYKCGTWTPSYNHDGDCSMSAKFEQVFEL